MSRCYRISKPKGQVTFRILTIAKTKKSVSISVKFFEILSDDKRKNSTKLNFKFIQPVAKSILGPSNIEYNGSHNSNAQQNFKTISVHEIDSLAPLTTTLVRKSLCKNMRTFSVTGQIVVPRLSEFMRRSHEPVGLRRQLPLFASTIQR